MTDVKISVKTVGLEEDSWPMLSDLWDFYNSKGIKTVFFSVGTGGTAYADLELAETLGCPLHIWDARQEAIDAWKGITQILTDRKCPDPDPRPIFNKGVDTKWVLPKNIRIHEVLPHFTSGTAVIAGSSYPTKSIEECVEEACESMKLKEHRIDLLKVALGADLERGFLYALLNTPFRPGMILVEWTERPQEESDSVLVAAHLSCCGYCLLAKKGSRFLYMFTDSCVYDLCSWEKGGSGNPLVKEILARKYRRD
jgi:hypothetical protein